MTTSPPPPAPPPAPRSGRLGQGELRRRVAAYLDAHSGSHTPGHVARELDRSAGAVSNALDRLVEDGQATRTDTHPRRYAANGNTAAAATLATGSPPPARPTTPASRTPAGSSAVTPTRSPGAPSPAPARGERTTVVARPDGRPYHPRQLADLPDVTALRKLREAGIPVLLYGPPGTGKTSLVEAAHPDLITVAGDGDTTVADFIGEYTQNPDGGYEFAHGPLVTAMTEGRCLFIDDATLISPRVLAVVYPAMDGRGQITVKAHKGETITAAPGFYVIAGHNPGVHGAVLTQALASRFSAQVHVSSDYDLARTLKIDPRATKIARNLAKRVESGDIGWAPQLRELIAFQKIADVLGTDAAMANLIGIAPEEDRDLVAGVVATVHGRRLTPLALGRQL
ncbi:AAA family ATPase [Spongiactinospora rosea]|uniref:AAA family ATPase n=1 Tax=Spongiactinospora rosea TaxID=2248750 RepID=A0A366LVM9_9ACTN|nr:AAA family ATPase [Spongiactinospora rosea]RBQ17242.1 AAA family ATPase [Spongiactinospora rosea]